MTNPSYRMIRTFILQKYKSQNRKPCSSSFLSCSIYYGGESHVWLSSNHTLMFNSMYNFLSFIPLFVASILCGTAACQYLGFGSFDLLDELTWRVFWLIIWTLILNQQSACGWRMCGSRMFASPYKDIKSRVIFIWPFNCIEIGSCEFDSLIQTPNYIRISLYLGTFGPTFKVFGDILKKK